MLNKARRSSLVNDDDYLILQFRTKFVLWRTFHIEMLIKNSHPKSGTRAKNTRAPAVPPWFPPVERWAPPLRLPPAMTGDSRAQVNVWQLRLS